MTLKIPSLIAAIKFATTLYVVAQAPGVPIFEQSKKALRAEEKKLTDQVELLMGEESDELVLTIEEIEAQLEKPQSAKISLPAPGTEALGGPKIQRRALKSNFQLGWAYKCMNCDRWHSKLAGAYAITTDGALATCAHVIDPDDLKMKRGTLIAVDREGKIYPVTAILSYNKGMDAAIVRIDHTTSPLPLNTNGHPGEAAYCLSRPIDQGIYFTKGIINRFYWQKYQENRSLSSTRNLESLRMNVSTRWAPGSSGSAVLDRFGNAIGHVSVILHLGESKKGSHITLHSATPARSVLHLAENMCNEERAEPES